MRHVLIGLASALIVASAAQAQPLRLRGTVETVDAGVLAIKTRDGDAVKVRLAPGGRLVAMVKASLADIKPGSFVGATAMPEEGGRWRAVEVHILPEAQRGAGEGDHPFDYRPQSTMTNGTVDAVGKQEVSGAVTKQGTALTLKFKGGEKRIDVTPDTVIYTYAEGNAADLKPGARVFVSGLVQQTDGTLAAARINVGRDVQPPM